MSAHSFKTFALVFVAILAVSTSAKVAKKSPQYTISLDDDASTRWNDAIDDFYDDDFEAFLHTLVKTNVPSFVIKPADWVASLVMGHFGDYGKEMMSMVTRVKSHNPDTILSPGLIMLLQFVYEFGAPPFCTSVVAQDANGHVLHGRNLDYSIEGLENIIIDVTFTKGGQPLYKSTMFAGYLGVLTGMRHNGWTVSLDQRDQDNSSVINFFYMLGGRIPSTWGIRNALETQQTFAEGVEYLSKNNYVAPAYYILGGLKGDEGAVLTKKRSSVVDTWKMDASQKQWYLLETNYDHWQPAPSGDDRRDPGDKNMNSVGQGKISPDTLFSDVMTQNPTLNDSTKYTAILSASENYYQTTIWADK